MPLLPPVTMAQRPFRLISIRNSLPGTVKPVPWPHHTTNFGYRRHGWRGSARHGQTLLGEPRRGLESNHVTAVGDFHAVAALALGRIDRLVGPSHQDLEIVTEGLGRRD